jgi:lipoprotein-releasing system permease protein
MLFDFFQRFVVFAKSGSVVRKIAWLTMIGLAVSISSLVLVLSVMTAMNRSQTERTLSVEPHLMIEMPDAKNLEAVENHPITFRIKENPANQIFAYETQDVILRTIDGKFRGAVARGVTWKSLQTMLDRVHPPGVLYGGTTDVDRPQAGEVLIGVELARVLGVFEGDTLLVIPPEELLLPPSEVPKYEKVKVRQILVSNVSDVDSQLMFYIAGETLRSLHSAASLRRGAEIRLPDPDDADAFKASLAGFSDVKIETWRERNSSLFFALRLEKIMIGVFLGMASLIAGLSLISVILLLISQKTKEIGLLQALGYSKGKVRKLFASIGFLLAVFGVGSGILIGGGLSLYLQFHPLNILPDIYYDSQIPAEVQPLFILMIAIIGLLLAYFGAWFAVKVAITDEPSRALRNKN